MKRSALRKAALLGSSVLGLAVWQAPAADYGVNIIQNGGFENGGAYTGDYLNVTPSTAATYLPGWTIVSKPGRAGNVDLVSSSLWNPHSGSQSLDLNGTTPSAIYQKVNITTPGWYELSFFYAGNFYGGNSGKPVIYSIGDETSIEVALNLTGNPASVVWQQSQSLVWLEAGKYNLNFVSAAYDTPFNGPALDDVSLALVPEPIHYGMASVAGLIGLVLVDRARQRRLTC